MIHSLEIFEDLGKGTSGIVFLFQIEEDSSPFVGVRLPLRMICEVVFHPFMTEVEVIVSEI